MSIRYLIVLAVLGACGGGGGGKVAIADLPESLADAQCEAAVRCGDFPDLASCQAALILAGNGVETTIGAVEAGTIQYDEGKAGECLDQIASSSCEFEGFHGTNACADLFVGTVATGGACFVDEECANAGECAITDDTCDPNAACCPGVCQGGSTEVALGGACNGDKACAANTYCKPGAVQGADGTCSALNTAEGTACDGIDACVNPMYCNFDFGTNEFTVCTKAAASNATCDPTVLIACADVRDYCDATMTCVRAAGAGQACAPEGAECLAYATCTNMTCVTDPLAGDACVVDAEPSCLGTLECTAGTCQPPAPGMSCL